MASHHEEFQVLKGKLITRPVIVLAILVAIGFFFIGVRYVKGIGAVSNLSDGYPWGIWIAYDVATGTALACGGYALALLIYIMNRWKYHPLIRSALLTSLFGYCLAGFSVMVDLGRFWNAYGFFLPERWQGNSIMFEVALCVMTYSLVLLIEFLPAVLYTLEHSRWGWLRDSAHWLHPRLIPNEVVLRSGLAMVSRVAGHAQVRLDKVLIFFIVLGITLPSMHQSSLGTMMIIAGTKLHPLWQTPFLPALFLMNCIFMGYGIVIVESIVSCYGFRRPFEVHELSGIARLVPWIAGIWVGVRFGDLIYRGQLANMVAFDFNSCFFLLEAVMIITASVLLLKKEHRMSPRFLFISAALLVTGGGLYRFNVYLIGFNPGPGWHYFPSFAEFMITVGIVALEILGYLLLVKIFPVLPNPHKHYEQEQEQEHSGILPGKILVGR
jgi:Ni/Fe-hydrogenase subunit HybB-like protein